uniref:Probable D-lactate dehydrogenase, mitochondrial n=1 Tax=Syphacia muris TaxID=451379 RepID=A0A0N5AHZ0_9BILA
MLCLKNFVRRVSGFKSKEVEKLIPQLEQLLGSNNVKTSDASRQQHSHDEGHFLYLNIFRGELPDVVVLPKSVNEVSSIAKLCNDHRVSIIPFGTGTGLEGGVNAIHGGVSLDLMLMDKIVSVNAEDFTCTVQPGVTRKKLNSFLKNSGLWFAVELLVPCLDPGADASICGMAATCASGTNAVRYGTMLTNVLNLEVVLPNGEILNTRGKGRRPRKSAAGYNLTELFVGSEGTLGVITEATVRLHAYPSFISAAVCNFPTVYDAVNAVVAVLQCSVPVARIEFMDQLQVAASNKFSHLEIKELPSVFLEFHGCSEDDVKNQAELVGSICQDFKGGEFTWSHLPEERDKLWTARHNALYAVLATKRDSRCFCTDVCVPISHLADVITNTRKDIDESGVFGTIVGHVGDGNFHCMFPVDEQNKDEMKRVWGLSNRLVERALAVGGSCTGEHGVGLGKREYIKKEFGDEGITAMRAIKKAFDPNGIMNPGKIFL